MGLDHSKAFVRLRFDGLITFCLNRRVEPHSCEMGMVRVEDHRRLLVITRINPNGTEEVSHGPFELNANNEVIIEAIRPEEPGARLFQTTPADAFNAADDAGDPEDYRWIIDLQGEKFHGRALKLKRGDESERCRPRIFIPHGTFYTYSKTPHQYMRYPSKGNTRPLNIGKIADRVGADIVTDPVLGKVTVQIKDMEPITLSADGLKTRYWIDITNLCAPDCAARSDFKHYYRVADDEDEIEFDVRWLQLKGTPGADKSIKEFIREETGREMELPEEFERFRSNGPPQVCNVTFLGESNTIP
ncbi:MAG TPA: hypothetical protein VK422_16085 [Pyrinomonadaceae bacterium]|nr:hypothetical protein [Pyrinomonadaceae bacterium]